MHRSTIKKVEFLQSYINGNFKAIREKFGENILGISIAKKRKAGKVLNYYSLVFKVSKKQPLKNLEPEYILPEFINITTKEGKNLKIKTDVIQSGDFIFQISISDSITNNKNLFLGTLGLILNDDQGNFYGLTNYHVTCTSLINSGTFDFNVENGDGPISIKITNRVFFLFKGTFSDGLDIMFILLGSDSNIIDTINENSFTNGKFVEGPILSNFKKPEVVLYLNGGNVIYKRINDNSAAINSRGNYFYHLLTVDKTSEYGDSGSLVTLLDGTVLGIVLGSDDSETYILPYYKIDKYFSLQII